MLPRSLMFASVIAPSPASLPPTTAARNRRSLDAGGSAAGAVVDPGDPHDVGHAGGAKRHAGGHHHLVSVLGEALLDRDTARRLHHVGDVAELRHVHRMD